MHTPATGALLIIGIPGAGKTTVARKVAGTLDAAAHIEADAVHMMIRSGRRDPDPNGDVEADRQLLVRAQNAGRLADSFAESGFFPVIDDVVVRKWHLEHWIQCVTTRPLHIVLLAPEVEVALQRDTNRDDKTVGAVWAFLDGALREELSSYGVWIDTSSLSVDETVARVLGVIQQP